jgi:hypothetical protein
VSSEYVAPTSERAAGRAQAGTDDAGAAHGPASTHCLYSATVTGWAEIENAETLVCLCEPLDTNPYVRFDAATATVGP